MQIVDARQAVARIESGQRIYVHEAAMAPSSLLDALCDRGAELRGVELVHLHTVGPARYASPEFAGRIRHNALFVGPNVRAAVQEGLADFTPVFLSEIPALFRDRT
ncbi:MAG: 4-hydroxybutyrate CoA-transferase, partial [Myxococcales bacterium]|nr:4-hydroxybutyrate CoA-transferase [Myxococcales bacterium]